MITDLHSHSKNSPDALVSVEKMCEQAISLGLDAYAITDHVECKAENWYEKNDDGTKILMGSFKDIFNSSLNDISLAKEKFKGKLNLLCGLELGEPCQDLAAAEKYVSDKRLDFVIASDHEMRDHEDFYFLDYTKENIPELFSTYFNEV